MLEEGGVRVRGWGQGGEEQDGRGGGGVSRVLAPPHY